MALTRRLDPTELRILGALMEKEQTTPDAYPLTTNALIAGCNQKSNRHPVTRLSETEVVEALDRLRRDVLAWRVEAARAERWEHRLVNRWRLGAESKALMTLLMLRGPQTPGELRSRSERLHSFADTAAVELRLRQMAEGDDALVRELPREPGQRERRWAHIMGRDVAGAEDDVAETAAGDTSKEAASGEDEESDPVLEERMQRLEERVRRLEERLEGF